MYTLYYNKECTFVGTQFYIIKKMYSTNNIKIVIARPAKEVYQYKNTKDKLHRTNAAIWYNKLCRQIIKSVHLSEHDFI
jgi:hypothetical protein